MKLTAAQRKKSVTIQAKVIFTFTEDLEDSLLTWGIDPEEYEDLEELLDALSSTMQERVEDLMDYTTEQEWEVEEISAGATQLL